ncbi:MAG: hypothetical protein IPM23_22035 [Candidatus Melainabacteria bacterium]|nr:hypothetical protein [Candidatus Melainabacteria bacterium]
MLMLLAILLDRRAGFRSFFSNSAIPDLDRALSLNPTERLLFIDRATCYEGLGEHRKALADYLLALKDTSNPTPVYKR